MRLRCGFTLLETLVVVAVIALLAAILLPSLSKARQLSRSTGCKCNLRQLGIGMTMYINQYSIYPGHQWRLEDPADTRIRWFHLMARQLAGYEVQGCPMVDWEVDRNNSYGYNYKYLGSLRDNAVGPKRPLENYPVKSIRSPARTIAFGDTDGTGWTKPHQRGVNDKDMFGNHGYVLDPTYIPEYSMYSYSGPDHEPYAWKNYRTYISTRHMGGSNFCFADGHVEPLRPEQVYRDNRYWNGLGGEDPVRDPHVTFKFLDGEWRFPGI